MAEQLQHPNLISNTASDGVLSINAGQGTDDGNLKGVIAPVTNKAGNHTTKIVPFRAMTYRPEEWGDIKKDLDTFLKRIQDPCLYLGFFGARGDQERYLIPKLPVGSNVFLFVPVSGYDLAIQLVEQNPQLNFRFSHEQFEDENGWGDFRPSNEAQLILNMDTNGVSSWQTGYHKMSVLRAGDIVRCCKLFKVAPDSLKTASKKGLLESSTDKAMNTRIAKFTRGSQEDCKLTPISYSYTAARFYSRGIHRWAGYITYVVK